MHEQSIKNGTNGMTSWGLMSVIYPAGNQDRFSCFTWDGFNTMADALAYLSYSSPDPDGPSGPWQETISKSKMNDIMPDGFQYSIIYERVMSVGPDN